MDFISLDVIPKGGLESSATTSTFHTVSSQLPLHRTVAFKAIAIILFVSILCFPQPEWLLVLVQHPIGALALASLVSIAFLPEVEWWVVVLSVGATYLLFALTGLIESNLETKRQTQNQKEQAIANTTQAHPTDSDALLQLEQMQNPNTQVNSDSDMGMHPSPMADPVASNTFLQ